MTIKELRDYLNGLSDEVLDYRVTLCGGFDIEFDENRDIELHVTEIEYKERFAGKYRTNTRLQNEEDIKRYKNLYLTCDSFDLRKDESLVIVQNDYKIINSDSEVVW